MQTQTLNTQDALAAFDLDFTMTKRPMFTVNGQGQTKQVVNTNAMVRDDTGEVIDGVSVSDTYEVIQNQDYISVIERVTGELNADFVDGGMLKGGRLTYLQCKLPETIKVKGTGDAIEEYLTFVNSFDGSSRFMIIPTGMRIVCANQMKAIVNAARYNGLRFTHTKNVHTQIEQADRAILEAMNAFKGFEVKVNWLADTKMTDLQMNMAIKKVFNVAGKVGDEIPTRTFNNMAKVAGLRDTGLGMHGWENTAWGLYNQFTEFSDHHRVTRRNADQFENRLLGSGATFKAKALTAIEEVVAQS